jgi:hypothetical protein
VRKPFAGLSYVTISFVFLLAACASAPLPTPTPYPTSTPYPTNTPYPTPIPPDEAFINDLYDRIDRDDTIPESGKLAIAALYYQKPTFAFRDNTDLVLQFNILDYPAPAEAKKAAVLLMGTGVIVAGEHGIQLDGIEVVYYKDETQPWLALWSTPPFGAEQFFLTPLADELIKELTEKGIITPIPSPTATEQPTY